MPLELFEDAMGDPRNARFLAVASDLAYCAQAEGGPLFKEKLGLDATLFSVGNTQAYVAQNDNHIVVAFRGTESPTSIDGLKDWLLTNAANLLIVPEGRMGTDFAAAGVGARFHQGFVLAITDIWEPVYQAVDAARKQSDRPIWITGHSLGGALAMLAAWLFNRRFVPIHQIYTFGAPMIGNEAAAAAFNKAFGAKIFRYVNTLDPIPCLPTVSLDTNDYAHCEKEVPLGVAQAAASGLAFVKELAGTVVSGILNATLIDDIWKGVMGRLSAHGMNTYQEHIDKT
ncbi:MAG: lipase family protein [Gemmataceae bacterium]